MRWFFKLWLIYFKEEFTSPWPYFAAGIGLMGQAPIGRLLIIYAAIIAIVPVTKIWFYEHYLPYKGTRW